jgi:hypothetical protein
VNTLRFADPLDGFAYDTSPGGAFWETHDGGERWSEPAFLGDRELLAFGTGAGYAFALVGTCQQGSCSSMSLERSAVSTDDWTPLEVQLPAGADPVVAMTVHGLQLWLSFTTPQSAANQLLVVGTGSGASFTTYKSPCYPGLGGQLRAASPNTVWAVCPTGMLAGSRARRGGSCSRLTVVRPGGLSRSALVATPGPGLGLRAPWWVPPSVPRSVRPQAGPGPTALPPSSSGAPLTAASPGPARCASSPERASEGRGPALVGRAQYKQTFVTGTLTLSLCRTG